MFYQRHYKETVTDTNPTEQETGRTITFTTKFGEISVLSPSVGNQ
jgi:hypothetical protein